MMPMGHALPEGLTWVRLEGMPASRLVLAWNRTSTDPLIRSFTRIAAANYGPASSVSRARARRLHRAMPMSATVLDNEVPTRGFRGWPLGRRRRSPSSVHQNSGSGAASSIPFLGSEIVAGVIQIGARDPPTGLPGGAVVHHSFLACMLALAAACQAH
jgi:hypothetical protein